MQNFRLIFLLSLLLSQCAQEPAQPPAVGDQAPGFALVNLTGDKMQLSDFTQKGAVLLNFWAT